MGVEYSPAAVLGPEMRAALRGQRGEPAQNLAIAKMAIGTSIITYFVHKALAGEATGDYPTDPAERRRWELLRIQPQSIQIGGEWVSMQRLGPVGIVAHMGASLGTIIHHYDGQDDDAMTGAIWSGAVASANIFADNFQGLKNLFEAMNSEKKGVAFAASFAGSFVPSLVGQAASFVDPNMRKAEGLIDGLKYRVPWSRETILPKRDPLYGEPVDNPGYHSIFRQGTVNADPVKAELDRLQFYPLAPRDTIGTVKLPPHLYDEYQILAGANAHMLLDYIITRPGWQDIPPGVRVDVIRSVISAVREKAAAVIQVRHQEVIQRGIENRMDAINGLKSKKLRERELVQ
jgi:hypothetical protein